MRHILSASDLVIFVILSALGCWFIWHRPVGLDPASASTLAGALYGAAALLLGNWINRWNEGNRRESDRAVRAVKLKKMITARLVHIALSLITSKQLADAALESGTAPYASDLVAPFPETPSIVRDLGADLPLLDEPAIDALVTLESDIDIMRRDLERRAAEGIPVSAMFGLRQVVEGLGHNLEILARCFERIAPTRKFEMDGRPPELVATILRGRAQLPPRVRSDEAS